jgi:arylsulfatase A-like enzyme
MFKDARITRRPNCRDVDPYTATVSPRAPRPKENDPIFKRYGNNLDLYLRLYHAMVAQLDANVGRLLAALDRLGLRETTAVIFTSDHGDMAGSHGLKNKGVASEESARIPLVVRVPGARGARGGGGPGQVSDALASSVDLLPTCLGLAGLPPKHGAEGADLSPVVRGAAPDPDRPVFSEMGGWCMVRRGACKLVARRPGLQPEHLFNLQADPYEMTDLVDDPAHASTREALLATLRDWNARVTKGT